MLAKLNKKAWNIRRNAARRFNCPVMEISWKDCLRMAKEGCIAYLDKIVRAYTASDSFEDLLTVHRTYNPTIYVSMRDDYLILANAFDYYMKALHKQNRAYRV